MKTKLFLGLALLATLSMVSCKKDKEEEDSNAIRIDGKSYPTVTIGNRVWTTENFSGSGSGVYYQEDNVHKIAYGKYYTLAEAKAIALPQGWRLPTKDDFKELVKAQGAIWEEDGSYEGYTENMDAIGHLLSTTGWPNNLGTNASGFNAQPAGKHDEGDFMLQGYSTYFWTSTTTAQDEFPVYFSMLQADNAGYAEYRSVGWSMEGVKMSVRFVKDK